MSKNHLKPSWSKAAFSAFKVLFGETIKTALLAIVCNEGIERIEELGVTLADGNTPTAQPSGKE